jgi:hypothetical protein
MLEGVNLARVIAAAMSLALTAVLMILFRVFHSPAGDTRLIISLGIITRPFYLLAIEAAVALIVDSSAGNTPPPRDRFSIAVATDAARIVAADNLPKRFGSALSKRT